MAGTKSKWEDELGRWLKPFLDRLGHKARRRMCPLDISGLIGPGDRKSVAATAGAAAPGEYDQLHHFIADGVLGCSAIGGGTAGSGRSPGRRQGCGARHRRHGDAEEGRSFGWCRSTICLVGKTANCQTLVSRTLARGEVPLMVALRLSFPRVGRVIRCVRSVRAFQSSTAQRGPSQRSPWRRSTASSPPVCVSAVCLPIWGTAPAGLSVRL